MKRAAKQIAALFFLTASAALCQCVMCFRTAAAQQVERQRVLNNGIFIMLAPPFLILAGFLWLAKSRNQPNPDSAEGTKAEEEIHSPVFPGR